MASRRNGSPSSWFVITSMKVVLPDSIWGLDGGVQFLGQIRHGGGLDAFQSAGLGYAGVGNPRIQLGANKVIVVPEGGVPFLRPPTGSCGK